MRLCEVEPGRSVRVKRITGGPVGRFMEMGLLPGTEVKVVKRAPLGDPIEVIVRGYRLSLRLEEAKYLEVE
ncbi:ferrous iron transport protein A [Thermococcus indicus]|uniref:Ferrous iron transport protein A n=1 Tax=Thermococcus indicus TaxID=2586643 RepID=A0A4Y5SN09_9EURY|nr:FeoA family protein [Thermococcus indicus]QDA31370.1 ferrous iron transport protein A [Thermococcus indicus]